MGKKAAKKVTRKAGKISPTAAAERKPAKRTWSMSRHPKGTSLAVNEALSFPRYACMKTGVSGKCILYEYNNRSRQYDLLVGPTDCSSCTHFIEPVG